jgi:hypothetical protein
MHVVEFKPDPAHAALAEAIHDFEHQFTYPLADGRSFKKLHDTGDYSRFFRAIGPAACFVALDDHDRILGTVGLATTKLRLPDGQTRNAAYLADFKIAPDARYGGAIYQLGMTAFKWALLHATLVFFVVIDGSPGPHRYSGKLGLPSVDPAAPLALLDIPTAPFADEPVPDELISDERTVRRLFQSLSRTCVTSLGGDPALRAHWTPTWLATPDHSACACVEDNRMAKRLLASDGHELLSRHLTFFGAASDEGTGRILRAALSLAAHDNVPSLYAVLHPDQAGMLNATILAGAARITGATIYAYSPEKLPRTTWALHAAEI